MSKLAGRANNDSALVSRSVVDNQNVDRTLRTVFTHDHFGPSTHQQAGLYAGLLVEPTGASWRDPETGTIMGRPASQPPVRSDGGPTSWKVDILTTNTANQDVSYREFMLEFQDLQLAYAWATIAGNKCTEVTTEIQIPRKDGWIRHTRSTRRGSSTTVRTEFDFAPVRLVLLREHRQSITGTIRLPGASGSGTICRTRSTQR